MTDFPCPVPPRPAPAGDHCRHYSFDLQALRSGGAGPCCALGLDLSAPGASTLCMPETHRKGVCGLRQDHGAEERAAWKAWQQQSIERSLRVLAAIPSGPHGEFPCPACGNGTVRFVKAAVNGHLHAACSIPHCFQIIQ